LCSWELGDTFDTPSCCVSNTRLDRQRHTKQEPWNMHTYSQISHGTDTVWRKHVECDTENLDFITSSVKVTENKWSNILVAFKDVRTWALRNYSEHSS
jgi:hypothetical protein